MNFIIRIILIILLIRQIFLWYSNGINGNNFIGNITILLSFFYLLFLFFQKIEIRILISSFFITLITIESILYLSKTNLSYNEVHGGFYYSERTTDCDSWYKIYKANVNKQLDRSPEFIHKILSFSNGLIDTPKFENTDIKMIVIGDSFTEGVGGSNPDSSWVKKLESKLNNNSDCRFNILNAGIAGSDPIFETKLFIDRLAILRPNFAIMCINESDIRDVAIKGGQERFLQNGQLQYSPISLMEYIYASSYLSRLILNVFNVNQLFVSNQDEIIAVEKILNSIDAFSTKCQKMATVPIIVLLPTEYELDFPNKHLSSIKWRLDSHSIFCIDLNRNIKTYLVSSNIKSKEIYWEKDRHFNNKGYDIIAKSLQAELRRFWVDNSCNNEQ